MTNNKVDIFELLDKIDSGDFEYYESLTPEQQKSISMVVASRWLSCTKNTKQLIRVNSIINPLVYKFAYKHPKLLYKLMLVASSGTKKQYKWVPKKKTVIRKPVTSKVIAEYYGFSLNRASEYAQSFSLDEVIDCAMQVGTDDADIKKIKNEFKSDN